MPPGFPDLPVVLVSHRGPVSFRRDQTGARTASRGAGGLVTALTGLASSLPDAVWICAATTNEDVAVAAEHGDQAVQLTLEPKPRILDQADHDASPGNEPACVKLRLVQLNEQAHDDFYTVIANRCCGSCSTACTASPTPPGSPAASTPPTRTATWPLTSCSRTRWPRRSPPAVAGPWSCCTTTTSIRSASGSGSAARTRCCHSSCTSPGRARTPGGCCPRPGASSCSPGCSATTSPSTPKASPATSCCASRSCWGCRSTCRP
jgi:hypothetical protein